MGKGYRVKQSETQKSMGRKAPKFSSQGPGL